MNKQSVVPTTSSTSHPAYLGQGVGPHIQLSNQHWSAKDGIGFIVGKLHSMGDHAVASAMKLSGVYPILQPDPYDPTHCRFRGMATGCLYGELDTPSIQFSDSTIHQQSENVEHPDTERKLPAVPMGQAFQTEIATLVKTVYQSCKPASQTIQYGCHWKAHLQRMQPTGTIPARATPPTAHKDNACWVFVVVLDKANIDGGTNVLYSNSKEELARFNLAPLQYFALDDRRYYHHVEDVYLEDNTQPGYRDVLIIEINTLAPSQY